MKYLKYLWYVLKHKWYVFLECRRRRLWLLGILHDWSKLRPSEFFPYADYFYGNYLSLADVHGDLRNRHSKFAEDVQQAFDFAWLLHQKRNKHHWQWWILTEDEGGLKVIQIHEKYLNEMLCDWHGASRAQKSKSTVAEWYAANVQKMQLHRHVKADLDDLLGRIL